MVDYVVESLLGADTVEHKREDDHNSMFLSACLKVLIFQLPYYLLSLINYLNFCS